MSFNLIDSHAHYNDSRFEQEFPGGADAAMRESVNSGIVVSIINAGTNPKTSMECLAIAEQFKFAYAAVGIHPTDCQEIPENERVSALMKIRELSFLDKAVAIGEIGLDYHYDDTDREVQKYFFRRQMEMAGETGLPAVIHDRDAHGDCMNIVREFPDVKGVFHCFTGSAEMANELVRMGWYISFSGTVSYKNAVNVKTTAAAVPPEKILIETDCPYLAPVPHRGKINYSAYMHDTLAALAQARGESPEYTAAMTMENTCRLFGINL